MNNELTTQDIANVFCIGLSLMVSFILFFYYKHRPYIRLLTLSYFVLTLSFFDLFLLQTRLILKLPHFYRTGYLFGLIYIPLSYLYMRTALTRKEPTKLSLLHFLPALLYLIDFARFFFSSGATKITEIELHLNNSQEVFDFSEGMFLPDRFYVGLLGILAGAYWVAQMIIIMRVFKRGSAFRTANEYWGKWMLFYVSFQFVIFVPALLIFLTGDAQYFFRVSYVFSILGSAFMVLSFFIHPGISDKQRTAVVFRSKNKSAYDGNRLDPAGEGYTHTLKPLQNLTRKQIAQMKNEIDTLLRRSLPFLRHGYSLQEMATSLSFPQYQLSALINQEYGMNFNELVNKYRIDYAIHSIRDGKASHLNINGLADQCGFNNRNSFTTAFKKFTGLTPSEYFKTLEH